ncbi:MAG: YraN family protein [Verrucomicrobiales bacterium]|nr:YraN family protein [Verrucomicrobiales bacterium]
MKWFRQIWYQVFDRELVRPVVHPDRDSMESAEWNAWVGATGERLSAKFLSRGGCKVLYRNFRPKGGGEVDIVYRDREILVFGEVKTRTSDTFGRPAEAVNKAKQRLVIRGGNAWLRELNHPEIIFRFDVIEVLLVEGKTPEINVIESAFSTEQIGVGM